MPAVRGANDGVVCVLVTTFPGSVLGAAAGPAAAAACGGGTGGVGAENEGLDDAGVCGSGAVEVAMLAAV